MIITTAIIKGGTGKSTSAAALAQAAIKDGKKVLCIDLDAQANLTYFLGASSESKGSYDVITAATPKATEKTIKAILSEAIQETEQGIDCMAASAMLSQLTTSHGSALRLQRALQAIDGYYDLIVIDTPPAIGELAYNALQAADGYIIPLEADSNSLQGLYQIISIAQQIEKTNKGLSLIGAILTRYTSRSKINQYLRDTIAKQIQEAGLPYLGEIRQGVAVKEAQTLQKNLFEYAPKSNPAQDYMRLYRDIFQPITTLEEE